MHEFITICLAAVAGGALGTFFFGGLWWTVSRGVKSAVPAVYFLGSLLARMGVVVVGFLVTGAGHWERLLACLLGFTIARVVVTKITARTRLTRQSAGAMSDPKRGGTHAS